MSDRPRPDPQQGVFETLLVVAGRPVELDAHLARLAASLVELFPGHEPPPLDVPVVDHLCGGSTTGTSVPHAQSGDPSLGSMRITVAPDRAGELKVSVLLREVERERLFDPPSVALNRLPLAGGLGAHKWADRSLLEAEQARLPADSLPLIVDRDGTVLEASRANVFAVRQGRLLTPPEDGRILPGVTRACVLEIAAAEGLETHQVELSRDELLSAEEVFLTSSVRGIELVKAVDGAGLAADGDIGSRLATELRRTWAGAAQVG